MTAIQHMMIQGLKPMGIAVSPAQLSAMEIYGSELIAWNKKINLTAITHPRQIAEKHFIDSLAAARTMSGTSMLMDIGSGGGFPGLVLKIMNPEMTIVLVDSVRKKINFLKQIIRRLDLKNIEAVHSRIEDLQADPAYTGRFDAVTSRAFAGLEKFTVLGHPFLCPGGTLYALKGRQGETEISQPIKNRYHISIDRYRLPFEQSHRQVIQLTPRTKTD